MVTHQIPRHRLATVQYRKQRLVLGLGRVDREGWLTSRHPHIHYYSGSSAFIAGLVQKRTFLYFFSFGKGS